MNNYRNLNQLDISRGLYSGISSVNEFGRNPEIDTGSPPVDIWSAEGLLIDN